MSRIAIIIPMGIVIATGRKNKADTDKAVPTVDIFAQVFFAVREEGANSAPADEYSVLLKEAYLIFSSSK